MRSRLSVLVAATIAISSTAGCAARSSSRVVELHRVAFATINPGHPYTRAATEAQIELARAYANGWGVGRNVAFGCGLAQNAVAAAQDVVPDVRLRVLAERATDAACERVVDRDAASRLTNCPVFGVTPQTLDVGAGARLILQPTGVRLENATGAHDDPWIVACGDIVVSPRIVRAEAPPGTRYVPTFLEIFLWHQAFRDDGTNGGHRLEWKVMEILPWGLPQADGAVVLQYPSGGYIWPSRRVPRQIARGATLRVLPSGEVAWSFKDAPEFGSGVIGVLGAP